MKQFFKILLYFLIISICIGQRPYYKGEWKKNRYHGYGELLDKFGNKYVGEFFEGIKHGKGVLNYSNGARFEGQFVDGKKTEGTYYYSNGTKYIGKWKRGKKHGNGIFVNRDGVKENQTWANGKIQIDNEKVTIKVELYQKKKKLNQEKNKNKTNLQDNDSKNIQLKLNFASADKLFLSKKYDEAKAIYQKIIKLDSLNYEAYARLGNLFYDLDRFEIAEEMYQKALKLNQTSESALNGLGNIRYQNSNFDEAINYYLKAYKNADALESSSAIIVDNLANVYDLVGEKWKAVQYYDELSNLSLENPNLLTQLWLADAYSNNNQLSKSDEVLFEMLRKKEEGISISSYMGNDISVISFGGSEKNKIKYLYSEKDIQWRLSNNNYKRGIEEQSKNNSETSIDQEQVQIQDSQEKLND